MNSRLNEMLATSRRDQFLFDAERHQLRRQARRQRVVRTSSVEVLGAAIARAGIGRSRQLRSAHAA
jgi:hypothetical protein